VSPVFSSTLRPRITFLHSGKPVNPSPPQGLDREPLRKGVMFSGKKSVGEMQSLLRQQNNLRPKELGDGAVKILKYMGLSVNVTI